MRSPHSTHRAAPWIARALMICAATLVACPPADKKNAEPTKAGACERMGQNCELSPGKLGTCVVKDGCMDPTPACLVCQSQH